MHELHHTQLVIAMENAKESKLKTFKLITHEVIHIQ